MRSLDDRPQTVLDLVREALADSRTALDATSLESIAKRLCERLKLSPDVPLWNEERVSARSFFRALHGKGLEKRHERLPVEAGRTTVFVPVTDICFVEARGHVVSVAINDRRFRFRGTLEECATRLRSHGFLRAHRAYLVNAQHVLAVTPLQSGLYVLHVDDGARSQIPVSRHYARVVRRSLAS